MAESEEELKSLLMKVKEESEKADLKLNIQKTKVMACSSITSWQINGKTMETATGFIFLGSKITADSDCSQEIKRCLLLGRKGMTNKERIKRQRHYFAYKDLFSQSHGFSSSHVQMWELDNKKGWVPKNWCLGTVVLEKTLDSPLDSKEIKPVNSKENQPSIFTERTDAEVEAPIIWPPDVNSWLIGKDPDAGKDWRLEKKGVTEDEMVGWHHWLNWHESKQTQGSGERQGSLAYCSPWGHKELDTTEGLNNNNDKTVWVILGRVVSEGPSRMVTFEQTPEWSEGKNLVNIWGKDIPQWCDRGIRGISQHKARSSGKCNWL